MYMYTYIYIHNMLNPSQAECVERLKENCVFAKLVLTFFISMMPELVIQQVRVEEN